MDEVGRALLVTGRAETVEEVSSLASAALTVEDGVLVLVDLEDDRRLDSRLDRSRRDGRSGRVAALHLPDDDRPGEQGQH